MNNEAEELFYKCCDRIDEDMQVAEYFLTNSIVYLVRDKGEKGIRKNVEEHLRYCNYEPYLRELRLISVMQEDSMIALITSSLDLTPLLRCAYILNKHTEDVDLRLVQTSTNKRMTHAKKARKIVSLMAKVSDRINKTVSLFGEVD